MILRRSRFLHTIPLAGDRVLLVHAVSHLRLVVDVEVQAISDFFAEPRRLPQDVRSLAGSIGVALDVVVGCVASLLERGFLTESAAEDELASTGARLATLHGRDPDNFLEMHRREARSGAEPAWAVTKARGAADLAGSGRRVDVLLFGDCDLQMEADFLRQQAAARKLDLHVAATFPDDVRFSAERAHEAILIGALRSRRMLLDPAQDGAAAYVAEARLLLSELRERSSAPILLDGLPEPTVQPLGLAERGATGWRNRVRRLNLQLAELVEDFADVHLVDIAAALGGAGALRLLDDGLVGFTHFGGAGWMLQRPAAEMAAVHSLFPDPAPLVSLVDGDPYGRERVVARAHLDALTTVLGHDRKKCVIVDLDGVLWPGVLAETGAPFAWSPEVSGLYSYIGLYVGLHEALKTLKRRGVLLACVSKNDETVVRELWRYASHDPHERLLTPEDFVSWRVNWDDKVDNIASIAGELGLALDSFVFIDDREIERDNVSRRLPQVEVWGEDPFALRRQLLTDPRLQVPRITGESAARSDLVKAQLTRRRAERSGEDFKASLDVRCRVERTSAKADFTRVEELFQRTTQFNTTGRRFPVAVLADLAGSPTGAVLVLHVSDRFGDHGLVGAAVIDRGEITGFAMSCRVIGLGAEHVLVEAILAALAENQDEAVAHIIPTARNAPVRNLYRDNGFTAGPANSWRKTLSDLARRRA